MNFSQYINFAFGQSVHISQHFHQFSQSFYNKSIKFSDKASQSYVIPCIAYEVWNIKF